MGTERKLLNLIGIYSDGPFPLFHNLHTTAGVHLRPKAARQRIDVFPNRYRFGDLRFRLALQCRRGSS